MELQYFPRTPLGPMIFNPSASEGISLETFVVLGFQKDYVLCRNFPHMPLSVPEGKYEEYKRTLLGLRTMQTDLAQALNLPVLAKLRVASPTEAQKLFSEREALEIG